MKNWRDIQEEIRNASEPVSPQAWGRMEAQLDDGKRGPYAALLALLGIGLFVSALAIWRSGTESKQYYQPKAPAERLVLDFEEPEVETKSIANDILGQNEKLEQNREKPGSTSVVESSVQAKPVSNNSLVETTQKETEAEQFMQAQSPTKEGERKAEGLLNLSIPALEFSRPEVEAMEVVSLPSSVADVELPTNKGEFSEGQSKIELRAFVAATYNRPSLVYDANPTQTHKQFQDAIENAVQPGWGYDAGLELRFRTYKNLWLSAGLGYREIVTNNNYDFEVSEIPVIDGSTGNILAYVPLEKPQIRQESSSNRYTFLSLPISLYYEKPLRNRFTLTGELINHISFLVDQSSYSIDPTSLELTSGGNDLFYSTSSSYQIRLGLRYKMSRNFFLALEPAYRKAYQDFVRDDAVSWRPEDFSISLTGIVKLR